MAALPSDMKVTPWFSAVTEPPVRVGYYEFKDALTGRIELTYWDGDEWCNIGALFEKDRWRGLLK